MGDNDLVKMSTVLNHSSTDQGSVSFNGLVLEI